MPINSIVLLTLAAVGVGGFLLLAVKRYRFYGINTRYHRRILLLDIVLLVMAIDVLIHTIIDIQPEPPSDLLAITAGLGRGVIIFAALALLATFPGDQDEER